LQNGRDAIQRATPPPLIHVERKQPVQQIVASGDAPEHAANPARGFLLPCGSLRRRAGHARKTASIDSRTMRSSIPETIFTAPIRAGSTKCTLPWIVFLSAASLASSASAEIPSTDGIAPYLTIVASIA